MSLPVACYFVFFFVHFLQKTPSTCINMLIFSQLDIIPINYNGVMDNYQKNGEFHLENYRVIKHSIVYACCPDAPFPDLTYYVVLRRRPMFYVFNLILPCVLINGIGKGIFASIYIISNAGMVNKNGV